VQLVFDGVARSAQGARDLAIGMPGEQLLSDFALGGSELRGVRRQKKRAAITWRPRSGKFSAILLSAAMSAFLIFDGLIKKHADSKGTYER
jgi:hypothetical protein